MESRLPDINTEFIMYRREAINCHSAKKYDSMFGAAYALNACLPKDYRVRISNTEYQDLIKQDIIAICSFCNHEFKYKDIHIYNIMVSQFVLLLTDKRFEKRWKCSECKEVNQLSKTRLVQNIRKKPYFLQVVPEPPERKDGLLDRWSYHKQVSQWFWQFMDEIAFQESKFREEYVPKDQSGADDELLPLNTGEDLDV